MFPLIIAVVLSYFVGSIPTALWVGRTVSGVDIRDHGSGNLGATNAFRVLGRNWGIVVLFIDVLKGVAPIVLLPRILGMDPTPVAEILIGASAILGHVFSCFAEFQGGKGVATSFGVFLAMAPTPTLILVGVFLVILFATRYVSLASISAAAALPAAVGALWFYGCGGSAPLLGFSVLIAALAIWRHRSNIERLMAGTEHRFDRKPCP